MNLYALTKEETTQAIMEYLMKYKNIKFPIGKYMSKTTMNSDHTVFEWDENE